MGAGGKIPGIGFPVQVLAHLYGIHAGDQGFDQGLQSLFQGRLSFSGLCVLQKDQLSVEDHLC